MVYYVQPVEPPGFVHLSRPWLPCRIKLKFAKKVFSNLLPQEVKNLPWHVFPSPVYPALQVQIYDPRELEQLALLSHTGEEALHSSTSEKGTHIRKLQYGRTKGCFIRTIGQIFIWSVQKIKNSDFLSPRV